MSRESDFFIEQMIGGITIALAILIRIVRRKTALDHRRRRWFDHDR